MNSEIRFLSITDLNNMVKETLDESPQLQNITIKGEILNFKAYPTALYFSLKDATSRIPAVMFFYGRPSLDFSPNDGDEVLVQGSVKVYPKDGKYQVYVNHMVLYGTGLLLVKLEQLKKKLFDEGLFNASKKRPLKTFPNTIGVISGLGSAAIKDISFNLFRRYPLAKVLFFPALVQGEKAPDDIIRALKTAYTYPLDTLIIGRGGGSEEDLWAFNDERVVRLLASSPIPTISAIGHEINLTLCDLAADVKASTPTAAAELATRDIADIKQDLSSVEKNMIDIVNEKILGIKNKLISLRTRPVLTNPGAAYHDKLLTINSYRDKISYLFSTHQKEIRIKLQNLSSHFYATPIYLLQSQNRIKANSTHLTNLCQTTFITKQSRLQAQTKSLKALNPYSVLERGYAVLTNMDGTIISSVDALTLGQEVKTTVKDGKIVSIIKAREKTNGN